MAHTLPTAPMPPRVAGGPDRWERWITASLSAPIDEDGNRYAIVLTLGKEFSGCTPENLRLQSYDEAAKRGYKVETRVTGSKVYFRFTAKE